MFDAMRHRRNYMTPTQHVSPFSIVQAHFERNGMSPGTAPLYMRPNPSAPYRQGVAVRQSIITLFLSRFTLNADEKEAIASRDVPVGPRFFAAMDKAAKIRDDCRVLMTGDEGDTKAGIDILSATAIQLEQAYDKIFRHCSFEFRQMGRDANLDVDPAMREAVRRLRQRPELLTYVPSGYLRCWPV